MAACASGGTTRTERADRAAFEDAPAHAAADSPSVVRRVPVGEQRTLLAGCVACPRTDPALRAPRDARTGGAAGDPHGGDTDRRRRPPPPRPSSAHEHPASAGLGL